jgi:HAD superfamily hydrolase (TIGR01509 family)
MRKEGASPPQVFAAILFDCDGVLVDSEPITLRVLTRCLQAFGWPLTLEQCVGHFLGRALQHELDLIEAHAGRRPDEAWIAEFRRQRDEALLREVLPTPGVESILPRLHAGLGGRIACASGADRRKIELQLSTTGLIRWFEGRVFSGHEMPRTKPAPDVYLAAAERLQVEPGRCLVVEDSPTGVRAGVSAGATVIGFLPGFRQDTLAEELLREGAVRVFDDMRSLPELACALGLRLGSTPGA